MQISAIIVDDEPLAREGLSLRMQGQEDFCVLAQCADGNEALASILSHQPDVVFLDIEMPGLSGIELINALNEQIEQPPKVVFVTAYQDFAVKAFDCHAFDYLLKPYTDERLYSCLDKLRSAHQEHKALALQDRLGQLLGRKTGKSLDGFIDSLERQEGLTDMQQMISLKSGSEWIRVNLDTILWIEAAGDYMYVHTEEGNHIIRKTLKQFEQELDVQRFPRVNRSVIVNLSKITKLTPNSNGEYFAMLSSGDEVKISRKYKFKLDELMGDTNML